MQVLGQIQSDLTQLKTFPEQVSFLEQRINEASAPSSASGDPKFFFVIRSADSMLFFKDVIINISNYDEYKISVFQISACERARDLLPISQEPQLVQLIINKLEGDAYRVVEGSYFIFVTDLTDKLKTIFASNKSQYRGELANIYKLLTETILKYVGRIKDLRTALIDTSRRQDRNMDKSFFEEINTEVLEAFTNGLSSELIVRMEHRAIDNLDHAKELAINLTRTMEVEKARERHLPRTTVANKPTRADLHSLPLSPETSTPVQILTKNIDSVSQSPLIHLFIRAAWPKFSTIV